MEYLESLRLNNVDVGFIATGTRLSNDRLDWVILKNAFLLIQHSFAERTDLNFSAEQLFDAFNSVVEASMRVTRQDIVQEPNKLAETLGE
jgi:hypothetical protein